MEEQNLYMQEREKIINLVQNNSVNRSLAEEIIKKSAYWYKHPSGHPVHAPNHFKRIDDPVGTRYAMLAALGKNETSKLIPSDWRIQFGSNIFLISKAILRCQSSLLKFIDNAEAGKLATLAELKQELKIQVRQSVANYSGDEYEGYYSGFDGNHLIFGTQSISTEDFVNFILSKINIHRIFNPTASTSSTIKIKSISSLSSQKKTQIKPTSLLSSQKKTQIKTTPSLSPSTKTHSFSKLVQCPYCGTKIKRTKLASHKVNKCIKRRR
jgi:hypothetical protein